jgi:hypothetical protein
VASTQVSGLFSTRRSRALSLSRSGSVPEPLAVLLLPAKLEEFELVEHARRLLEIPRVIALEPGRFRTPGWLRDHAPVRQVKRLRFPGLPRVVVLYHPRQYPLARALLARYEESELWYLRIDGAAELPEIDDLVQARSQEVHQIQEPEGLSAAEEALRLRLHELGIISQRPFVPGARIDRR